MFELHGPVIITHLNKGGVIVAKRRGNDAVYTVDSDRGDTAKFRAAELQGHTQPERRRPTR